MIKENLRNVQTFDSFVPIFKVLNLAGYYRLISKPDTKFKSICYKLHSHFYRPLVFLFIIVYNLQHLIFLVQVRHDADKFFACLKMEIAHINLFIKILTINLGRSRLDKLLEVMNDPTFAPTSEKDEQLLRNHTKGMRRFIYGVDIYITMIGTVWFVTPFAERMRDEDSVVLSYFPFETKSWTGLTFATLLDVGPLLYMGYGHLNMDCLIVTFYGQVAVQLRIIKYNLEHLFDERQAELMGKNFQYKDVADETINERFIYFVRRYEKVVWFAKEVTSVFNVAMSAQIVLTNAMIVSAIFEMSLIDIMSTPFLFAMGFYVAIQTQTFVYCYFTDLVKYESSLMANSLYMSNWPALSPRFHRQLIIAMLGWSRPLAPLVMQTVPLSLATFLSITRMSYTLFTVLRTTSRGTK